jgi:hypothetical protein
MLVILNFIFSKWYIFFGTVILIEVIGDSIATIIRSFKADKIDTDNQVRIVNRGDSSGVEDVQNMIKRITKNESEC